MQINQSCENIDIMKDETYKKYVCYKPKDFVVQENGFYIRNNESPTFIEIEDQFYVRESENTISKNVNQKPKSIEVFVGFDPKTKAGSEYQQELIDLYNGLGIKMRFKKPPVLNQKFYESPDILKIAGVVDEDYQENYNILQKIGMFFNKSFNYISKLVMSVKGNFRKGK